MPMLASPVMTERAEKSTRFPMRFPRTRPCFPLRRSVMLLMGRPDLLFTVGMPGLVLIMYPQMLPVMAIHSSSISWLAAPRCSARRRAWLSLITPISVDVRSSWDCGMREGVAWEPG